MDESKLSELRKISGYEAAKFIRNGFVVGLGTGRNARCFIDALGKRINEENLKIIGVPTSEDSKKYGIEKGIKIKELNEIDLNIGIIDVDGADQVVVDLNMGIDIDVDGADQVVVNEQATDDFSLLKGYGGALTREKIIAKSAEKFICVVDETKISETKNLNKPIPIEVVPFAVNYVKNELRKKYGVDCSMMKKKEDKKDEKSKDENFVTDNGNFIILANFGEIENPEKLEDELNLISGVVENGIFAKRKPDIVIVGKEKGVEILERK